MSFLPRPALAALARLRARLRASELGLVALAIGIGVLAGLCVTLMTSIVNFAHEIIYGIPFDVRLSAADHVPPLAAFVAPMLSGLALGSIDAWRARRKAAAGGRSRSRPMRCAAGACRFPTARSSPSRR